MARHAWFAWIVNFWQYLRETRRSRHVISVAHRAESTVARRYRRDLIRGVDVILARTVAHFAGKVSVIGGLFNLVDVVVTLQTGLIAGKGRTQTRNIIDGTGTVVAIFAEAIRNHDSPCREENGYNHDQQNEERYQLLRDFTF